MVKLFTASSTKKKNGVKESKPPPPKGAVQHSSSKKADVGVVALHVKSQSSETEIRRCVGFLAKQGDKSKSVVPHPVYVTVTNQRLLLQSRENSVAASEFPLSSIVKCKNPPAGLMASIKGGRKVKSRGPTLIVKLKNHTKYEVTFVQQPNSIYSPEEDRDEVSRLINEYIKIQNPAKS